MTPRGTMLDCTLRDGGYYTNWDFSRPLVSAYLRAVSAAGVGAMELGFRSLPQERFNGPFAYSSDEFLRTLPLPQGVQLGVMVNAKELTAHPAGPEAAIDALFQEAASSPITLVRVAGYLQELARYEPITHRLKARGYTVAINLMQASLASPAALTHAADRIRRWKSVDLLYLADSLGNMSPSMVQERLKGLRAAWPGPLGLHAHNNMEQAVANCLAAIEVGATWIDGTLLGMGRGAGNAQTEHLLVALKDLGLGSYVPEAVFQLVMEEFDPLKRQHGWGASLLYYLSGTYGIHPTYVQEMLGRRQYDVHHILEALEFLKRSGAAVYSDDTLEQAMAPPEGPADGAWSAQGWARGRPVLIVARGSGMRQHLEALCQYTEARDPLVVCLNANREFPAERVSAYAACHKMRMLLDLEEYRSLNRPLIAPLGAVPEVVRERFGQFGTLSVLDYGMRVVPGVFEVRPNGCTIPAYLVAAYVLALAEAGGASQILLAGFDGYEPTDPRQLEMAQTFRCYQARPTAVPLLAVTPTTYHIPKGSIYSPVL